MKTTAAISASLLSLGLILSAAPAMAQQGTKGFAKHDIDQDGSISREEFAQFHDSVFAAADVDENGMTLNEFLVVRMGARPGGDPERQAAMTERANIRKTTRFHAMDVDGDEVVAHDEFTAYGDAMFDKADVDADGLLTQAEFRQFHKNH